TQQEIDQVLDFANKIDTSYYAKRSQFDSEKRKQDQVVGKLGEIATYNALKEKYNDLSSVDFLIYEKNQKSWDFDLKANNINLHTKSQNIVQSKKYGQSWIFQKGNGVNRHYDKEVFDRISPNQYVSFVLVDLNKYEAEIKAIVSLDFLHKKDLFKLPVLERLRLSNKVAVYYDDIKEYPTQLWVL
ncbi:MAG: hypothetical protein EBS19_15780, partial [Spirochaetia bacterium]|nr:hypothetical protein [Spirochaetia bacterium]